MATVTVFTSERMTEIENETIVSGSINAAGHLVLVRKDGNPIDMGAVSGVQLDTGTSYSKADVFSYVGDTDPGAVPDGSVWFDTNGPAGPFASATQQGLVELATNAEVLTGTDTTRAVTPAGAAAAFSGRVLTSNSVTETALPSAYPTGLSVMTLTTGSGWSINSGFGSVVTIKSETDRTVQMAYANPGGTGTPRTWIRHYHSNQNGGGWTAWSQYQTIYTLTPGSFTQATAMASYPTGLSRLYYTSANSTSWDFSGNSGEVLTFVGDTDFAKQTFTMHSSGSGTPGVWVRTSNTASGWTAWRKTRFDSPGLPTAMAVGRETVTPSAANTPTVKAVTFPAGRFTVAPNVQVTPATTVPGSQVTGVSVNNVTTTGFDMYVTRTNTTATVVDWTATQMP